jgi:hypothetical protein
MTFTDFNTNTAGQLYSYRRNPLHEHSFLIIKKQDDKKRYEPIGDYTVLDAEENPALSEKTVMNLVALLNGKKEDVIDLSRECDTRLLYYRAPKRENSTKTHIIFYALGDKGVSKENAVLAIEEEFYDEFN